MKAGFNDITALSVVCNTTDYVRKMYRAFRHFHPGMKLLILDNSDKDNDCQMYLNKIASTKTFIYRFNKNMGHGRALNYGISKVSTPFVLIMDSDTQIIKSPVKEMLQMMDRDTYGVGWVTEIGKDGYDFGTWKHHMKPVRYLHPYFCLISRYWFYEFPPFVHHGAPFYKTMVEIDRQKKGRMLKQLPGLNGHTEGKGMNWEGTPSEYVLHPFGGTRKVLKEMGKEEIEWPWEL